MTVSCIISGIAAFVNLLTHLVVSRLQFSSIIRFTETASNKKKTNLFAQSSSTAADTHCFLCQPWRVRRIHLFSFKSCDLRKEMTVLSMGSFCTELKLQNDVAITMCPM